MLLAHKIRLFPTEDQKVYLEKAFGTRRHCYNQLLNHFSQPGQKFSKKEAYQQYKTMPTQFPWYKDVSSRVARNTIDDLAAGFDHFFRRVKQGVKKSELGFPTFKKKGLRDSFSLRESIKFKVEGRQLTLEKLKGSIQMEQALRFSGELKQVTISKRAGYYFASILVDTTEIQTYQPPSEIVGVDLGVQHLAVLSTGEFVPKSQPLAKNLKKLKRYSKQLSKKKPGSSRRAKAKHRVARLHLRIARQRSAVLHELSDRLTREFQTIVIEDLSVKGMVKNRTLARAIHDAGFGMFRQQLEYKSLARGNQIIVADRFFPSTKTCASCGDIQEIKLSQRTYSCSCGHHMSRDLNAALNLEQYGRHTLQGDFKWTEQWGQSRHTTSSHVDAVNASSEKNTFCELL